MQSSIRTQLLLWLLLPLVALCTLSSVVAYRMAERFANDSYDKLLLESADSIAARLGRNESGIVIADLPMAAQAILRRSDEDRFYYQISDSSGHRLTGDAELPLPADTSSRLPMFRYAALKGEPVRMCRIGIEIPPLENQIWVQVAETLNSRQRLLHQIFLSIVVPQLALVTLASFSVWLGIMQGLAPLERLGKVLEARDRLDLSPVDIGRTPPVELAPVTEALNRLLLRANDQISIQRQFVANAAHQLRTPVTALKTYLDHANRLKDPSQISDMLGQMGEAANRVARLVTKLLSLARAEEKTRRQPQCANLTQAINSAASNVLHDALDKKVALDFELPADAIHVAADQSDVEEMLTNLLENAVHYVGEEGRVWVKIRLSNGHTTLTVEDDGPGIPDSEKSKIFDRFYRCPGARGAGCGLGLAIVKDLAVANEATVGVSDCTHRGTALHLKFRSVAT